MSFAKLFTPKIRTKRGNVLDRTEEKDMFANVPVHSRVPDTAGPTATGFPLRMSKGDNQAFAGGIERRDFRTKNETGEY